MNLARASIRRPVTTLMAFLCFIVIGGLSARLLPLEYFPAIDFPGIFVQIPYPGATPTEVERHITRPAEEVLATISGIRHMNTTSDEQGASIFLSLDWGHETTMMALEVREKLDGIRKQWPQDLQDYFVFQFSTTDMPILTLRISSDRDLSGSYEMLNRKVKRRLERIEGVSQVELYGVYPREVSIELYADRVAAHKVDLVQLSGMLQASDFSLTAGKIDDGNRRFMVRPLGELTSIEAIENLVVGEQGLRLRDIARVALQEPERVEGRHLNGSYAIGMNVSKESGANTVEVARNVVASVEELKDDPEMTGITIFYMDNAADGIVSSLWDLFSSGMLGALFAILVLFFFLRRFSTTFIVTLAVPVSLLITLGFLYFLGLTLNILSMMGLMLAIGMLVDNAVVVTESIHRQQLLHPGSPRESTLRGVQEVGLAVTAGTLTTAIVFLPFILSPADQITLFLKHVSISICVALVVSLLIAQTVVPLLTARVEPPTPTDKRTVIDRFVDLYDRILAWLVGHRWVSVGLILGTLASVALPASFVPMDFFPDDEGSQRRMYLSYHINGMYTLERVEETVTRVENHLFERAEAYDLESIYSYYQAGHAQSTLMFKDADEATRSLEEIREAILEELPKLAIARPSFSWENSTGEEGIRVMLSGESSERLAEMSVEIAEMLDNVPGLRDVRSEAELGDEEIRVVVDRERARQYGYSTEQIARTVSTAMRGFNLSRFRTPDGEVEMRLSFQNSDQRSLDDLRNLTMLNEDGTPLRLAALADLTTTSGPRGIQREDRVTRIGIKAGLNGLTTDEGRERVEQLLGQYDFPTGYGWGYGQEYQDEENSQQIMLINILLALVLIYLVMAALFESLIHPAAIWTSIIFAVVGVFWFFFITGTTFSLMAWIGVLILIGVVVNNGIVLIDHINFLRAEGLPRDRAILQAGHDRLRPILMTAATTVLGLIPLCMGSTQIGGDGPPYYPMARAIVGGLTFSTVITLIILPTIYILLDDLRDWSRRVIRSAAAPQAE